MGLSSSTTLAAVLSRLNFRGVSGLDATVLVLLGYVQLPEVFRDARTSMYNVLWVLVFGFATLNILGLAFRRLDSRKMGLTFGEIIAILVVVLSVVLFALEVIGLLHILPIHLTPQ